MQAIITFLAIGIVAFSLAQARPQGTYYNNYPNIYYTTAPPYQQNVMRIWPYIMDSAVSPLYNWNWYNNANTGYNNNFNNGYYNIAYGYTPTGQGNYNGIWNYTGKK